MNNKNETGMLVLFIIAGFIFYAVIKHNALGTNNITLVTVDPMPAEVINSTSAGLIDGWGYTYPVNMKFESVEPVDPYFTSDMVVPIKKDAVTSENIKKDYLVQSNVPYLHYEDDLLNRELLPPPKFLFVGP